MPREAVRTALTDMGVASDLISTRGFDEAHPVASNQTAAGRQMNRRVDIVIADEKGKVAPR